MIAQAELDRLWDVDDPATSERRFRHAAMFASGGDAAELLTQAARAMGMQGRFDHAEVVLRSIVDDSPVVRTRRALERGRLLTASGRASAAVAQFTDAELLAAEHHLHFLRIDARRMLAIADPQRAEAHMLAALRALDGVTDPRTLRWGVSLHSDLGWMLHSAGRLDAALASFGEALRAAEAVGTENERCTANWAIARCLRSLGRTEEALAIQKSLLELHPSIGDVADELALLRAD